MSSILLAIAIMAPWLVIAAAIPLAIDVRRGLKNWE